MRFSYLFGVALAASLVAGSSAFAQEKSSKITWKKTVIDTNFRSEGVAVADVNKDGKVDILNGEFWYEAPDWKPHVIRNDKKFDPKQYSLSFAVFADDLDGDGYPDQIVVGFPGAPCHWYKNPGKDGGKWQEFMIQDNACNETPAYLDLLGNGKKGLMLGHKKEVAYFVPTSDPTKPWEKITISGKVGDQAPGSHHFAHGLGAGDVNGDGKLDVMVSGAWYEQPAKIDGAAWKLHKLPVPGCADMYALDVDGDGKNDVIASAAHNTGFWWFQQKPGKDEPSFVQNEFFPLPSSLAKAPTGTKFSKEEADIYSAINKARSEQKKVGWRTSAELCTEARALAKGEADSKNRSNGYSGKILMSDVRDFSPEKVTALAKELVGNKYLTHPGLEIGVGFADGKFAISIGDRGLFALPGQSHALNQIDIDGDGVKDFVTGRRYWAHGPSGDDHPGDPAFLYWFQVRKGRDGMLSLTPHLIDDDSGIGTQFATQDVNGDGLPDVIISNKKGVFLFIQVREGVKTTREQ
ncbi:MAG: VCBS repeat-containing protein [Gemmataceae bacterium]|nr:VCBS repeat-containing protein [Gemmataceae bacterium]